MPREEGRKSFEKVFNGAPRRAETNKNTKKTQKINVFGENTVDKREKAWYNNKQGREGMPMSIFEGFTEFNFNEGVPYVSVTKNGVSFNKGVISKLGQPTHVKLFINAATKQIGIQVCDECDLNAQTFYNKEKKRKATH